MTDEVGVGLIGLGTVGSAVARRLVAEWELLGERAGATPVLRRVAVRDPGRRRDVPLPHVRLDADPEALVDDPDVAVVVEVMGGVDTAGALVERALRAGKPVVTANKALLAAHGVELAGIAAERGVSLRYEAAAGGGLPVVALLRDSLRGDRIRSLQMIINGTTNIILTAMERDGVGLAEALAQAQRRGFAEADPSADVDGHDAAAKLVLLGRLAFDAALTSDAVDLRGVAGVDALDVACAGSLGGSVKLVATAAACPDGIALRVRPAVVLAGHPLHGVDDAENALVLDADLAGRFVLRGPGGGAESTASAVVSDIVAAVREPGLAPPRPARPGTASAGLTLERAACVRVVLAAIPEAATLVVQALEDRGLDVVASASPPGRQAAGQLAVITAPSDAATLEHALETLDSLPAVERVASVLDCLGTA